MPRQRYVHIVIYPYGYLALKVANKGVFWNNVAFCKWAAAQPGKNENPGRRFKDPANKQ